MSVNTQKTLRGMMALALALTVPHPQVMALDDSLCPSCTTLTEHVPWDQLPRRPHFLEGCHQSPERRVTCLRSHSKSGQGRNAELLTPDSPPAQLAPAEFRGWTARLLHTSP